MRNCSGVSFFFHSSSDIETGYVFSAADLGGGGGVASDRGAGGATGGVGASGEQPAAEARRTAIRRFFIRVTIRNRGRVEKSLEGYPYASRKNWVSAATFFARNRARARIPSSVCFTFSVA